MSVINEDTAPTVCLPNGLTVYSSNETDTLTVYRDIFEDDCYRRHGVTISDGDCILDVGANTGLFILFLNQIGVDVRVYAFEPAPATFQVLTHNVRENNSLPVHLFNVGLSRTAGEATFTYYPRFSNASTFYPDHSPENVLRGREYVLTQASTLPAPLRWLCSITPKPLLDGVAELVRKFYMKKQTVQCPMWNLSEFLAQRNIEQVDLLKIDAERSEQNILAGIADRDWPKIRRLIVEVHDGVVATRDLVDMLARRGYRTAVDPNPAMPSLSLVYAVRD